MEKITPRAVVPPPTIVVLTRWLDRASELPLASWVTALEAWTEIPTETWFAADRALTAAIDAAGWRSVRETAARRARAAADPIAWITSRYPVAADAVHIIATGAVLALLAGDRSDPAHAEVLYRPFASVIPLASLDE